MFATDYQAMRSRNAKVTALGVAILAVVALSAGCGGSGSGSSAGSGTTSSPPTTSAAAGSTSTTKAGGVPAAGTSAGLAALKQQLNEAGSSLSGADGALVQSDPNQTKNAEGSAP